ncbi:MAG: glycosyltransferase [Planctomycetes bacterium]|nr:glycosyltransferase [Planctomycetota bacterium]
MEAIGLIAEPQTIDFLAEKARTCDPARTLLFVPPGCGVYGPLRRFRTVKVPSGAVDRRTAVRALLQAFPNADRLTLISRRETRSMPQAVAQQLLSDRSDQSDRPGRSASVPQPDPRRYQILVKSFRRFGCLRRLVESIVSLYPEARILVADDSLGCKEDVIPRDGRWVKDHPNVTWYQLPFDVGLAAGRNYLVQKATAPILINCDDDFVFMRETRLDRMIDVLDSAPDVGLVSGLVRQGREVQNYAGRFVWSEGSGGRRRLRVRLNGQVPLRTPAGTRYVPTDLGLNFFAARRDVLLRARWDEAFKVSWEHMDHFLTLHQLGIQLVYTPDVVVDHRPEKPAHYVAYRARRQEYAGYFFNKWNLDGPPAHGLHRERWYPRDKDGEQRLSSAGRPQTTRAKVKPPNVVVCGIGHSGTSIVTRMIAELGWHLGPADHFAELPAVRAINDRLIRSPRHPVPQERMRELLQSLPEPWVIKDPRFVHTIDRWIGVMQPYRPCLLWITRDLDEVAASYRRRGEGGPGAEVRSRGKTLTELWAMCASAWEAWPWSRVRISYEQLTAAVGLFRTDRRPGTDGWVAEVSAIPKAA